MIKLENGQFISFNYSHHQIAQFMYLNKDDIIRFNILDTNKGKKAENIELHEEL